MTFLPIVARELRVAARRRVTFQVRFAGAVIAAALGGLFLIGSLLPGAGLRSGATLFRALVVVGFGIALLAGAFLTADCLSRERREGTLGFLFLTDLNGFDVVLGKFTALGLVPLHGLLAMFPVAGMTVFLGGVTGTEFWRAVLVILNTLFLSLAIGLWISSVVSDERRAVGLTLGAVALLNAGPEALGWLAGWMPGLGALSPVRLASPTAILRLAFDTGFRGAARGYWTALGAQHALAWISLIAAAGIVRHAWRRGDDAPRRPTTADRAPARPRGGLMGRAAQRIASTRRAHLEQAGPIAWMAWRGSWVRRGVGWLTWAVALAALAAFAEGAWNSPTSGAHASVGWIFTGGFAGLKLLLAIHVVYFLQDACRSGTMELILTTPISSAQLHTGHFAALRHMFIGPVLGLGLLHASLGLLARLLAGGDWPSTTRLILTGLVPPVLSVALHALDLVAVAYYATRTALRQDRPAKALAQTALVTIVLPLVFCGSWRLLVDVFILGHSVRELVRLRELIRAWYFPTPVDRVFGAPRVG